MRTPSFLLVTLTSIPLLCGCTGGTAGPGPSDACSGVSCGANGSCVAGSCVCASCWSGASCGACATGCSPVGGACVADGDGGDEFTFVVFGDLNGGGCERNARVARLVALMAAETDVAFYVNTGDLIDGGYATGSETTCFARDPATAGIGSPACGGGVPSGNVAAILAPLKERTPRQGLASSFYPVIGNHDDNWGDGWYPDPCGDGICSFLEPRRPADFLNHTSGDICSTIRTSSAYGRDFYYSFAYKNSYFIILRLNSDDWNMISSCNSHPGYASCGAYCSDPALADDPVRNDSCWGGVKQFDWLRAELAQARATYQHIYVFGHAVLLGSGDSHGPTSEAAIFRDLLETQGVDVYFNGHNHAYERTLRVRGSQPDPTGTMYLTVGPAGAPFDYVNGGWFTAASYERWASAGAQGFDDKMATYVKVRVRGATTSGEVRSLGVPGGPADTF